MQGTGTDRIVINFLKGMESFRDRLLKEREARMRAADSPLSFGVSFLDEALGGLYCGDLVLIGAGTGMGKSQLATLIALHNAKQGKRVHVLALEAEEFEIERRIKYQLISDWFFGLERKDRPHINLNYLDWYYGKFRNELAQIETEIEAIPDLYPNLYIYYRDGDFGIKDFERIVLSVKDETDLIVIDHLHYFDHEDENENRAVKAIVKKIMECALSAQKPFILVSHVRKGDRRIKQITPEIEDFHGSSDIGKISTKAITLAPCFDKNTPGMRETYMAILKNRVDGSRMRSVGLLAFNFHTQRYEKDYYIGRAIKGGEMFEGFSSDKIPFWAKSAKPAIVRDL